MKNTATMIMVIAQMSVWIHRRTMVSLNRC